MTRAADLAKLIAGGGTITVADNSDTLTLESTDADANVGPVLNLHRNSASPADNDLVGRIVFKADDDAGNESTFARIEATATDVTNGSEDCRLDFISVTDDSSTATMSISSNKVGIGVTPAKGMLHIQPSARTTNFSASDHTTYADIYVHNPTDDDTCATGIAFATDASSFDNGASGIACISGTGDSESSLAFITRPNGAVAAEAMRINSSQNVGIGTTSPSTPLHVVGNNGILIDENGGGDGQLYFGGISGSDRSYIARNGDDLLIWNVANGTERFGTNNTERARITSGGNISLGANTASNIETTILMTMTGNGTHADHFWEVGPHYTADTPSFYTINESGTGVVLSHGNTSWSTHSDERIKENITSLENVLPDIKSVRCVKYNLKGQSDTKIGFIAQDWESKFPEVVQENGEQVIETDGSVSMAENSKSTTSVKIMQYTETIPVLLKAIQELEARIATLESK